MSSHHHHRYREPLIDRDGPHLSRWADLAPTHGLRSKEEWTSTLRPHKVAWPRPLTDLANSCWKKHPGASKSAIWLDDPIPNLENSPVSNIHFIKSDHRFQLISRQTHCRRECYELVMVDFLVWDCRRVPSVGLSESFAGAECWGVIQSLWSPPSPCR